MKRRQAVSPQTQFQVLNDEIRKLWNEIARLKQTGPSSIQADNYEEAMSPAPWEVMMQWPGRQRSAQPWDSSVYYHPGRIDQETGQSIGEGFKALSSYAVYAPKVFSDQKANRVLNDARLFGIHPAHDEAKIYEIYAHNGVPGTGSTSITLRNVTRSITIGSCSIASGANMNTTFTIDEGGDPQFPNNMVFEYDTLAIDVTAVGTGSKGLGLYISTA